MEATRRAEPIHQKTTHDQEVSPRRASLAIDRESWGPPRTGCRGNLEQGGKSFVQPFEFGQFVIGKSHNDRPVLAVEVQISQRLRQCRRFLSGYLYRRRRVIRVLPAEASRQ